MLLLHATVVKLILIQLLLLLIVVSIGRCTIHGRCGVNHAPKLSHDLLMRLARGFLSEGNGWLFQDLDLQTYDLGSASLMSF